LIAAAPKVGWVACRSTAAMDPLVLPRKYGLIALVVIPLAAYGGWHNRVVMPEGYRATAFRVSPLPPKAHYALVHGVRGS
jgi:hypothetical protein